MHFEALRCVHTAGFRPCGGGEARVYDAEGELLFGKVTGIVARIGEHYQLAEDGTKLRCWRIVGAGVGDA
jgi:hypothetical protein